MHEHPSTRRAAAVPTGIGLGLRARFLPRVAAGEADGRVAFFEVSPENFMHRGGANPAHLCAVADRHPLLSHGLMMSLGGTDPFDREYFATLRAFLDRFDPPWHSDHACWSGVGGALLHELLPVPFTSRAAARMARRIAEARDRLERPMAVENISWYCELGDAPLTEPRFLAEVLDAADCGLLLDVNNVFVNATNHGFDPYDWLREIPLERVWQLHVAGHERWEEDLVVDTHGADVRDEVYEMLGWVVERTGPLPVLLERDANIPPLPRLLDEVARLDDIYRAALARRERDRDHAATPPRDQAEGRHPDVR